VKKADQRAVQLAKSVDSRADLWAALKEPWTAGSSVDQKAGRRVGLKVCQKVDLKVGSWVVLSADHLVDSLVGLKVDQKAGSWADQSGQSRP
jgi:hypothetical protein